jgi:hypothetical protein
LTTRSAVLVRGVISSVRAERTAVPRPRRSALVIWRRTGHERNRLRMPIHYLRGSDDLRTRMIVAASSPGKPPD